MSVLLVLIAVSLLLSAAFVLICIASIRGGQFDDLESPRWRILFSDSGESSYMGASWKLPPLPGTKHDDPH